MEQFGAYVLQYIDPALVAIVILSGFFQARYCKFRISKDDGYDKALKTLFVSVVASAIFIHLVHKTDKSIPIAWAKYFFSYFFATSAYELILGPVLKWFRRKTGDDLPDQLTTKP